MIQIKDYVDENHLIIYSLPLSSNQNNQMKNVSLSEVMTKQLVSLSTEDTVEKLAALFAESNIHHVPVVDRDNNLIGIVSKTDLDQLGHGSGLFKNKDIAKYNEALYRSLRVVEVMTKKVTSLKPENSIEDAYQIFKNNRFRAIPIVDDKNLVGIVCPLDLLDYVFAN
jgi:CBS domain-containing protein